MTLSDYLRAQLFRLDTAEQWRTSGDGLLLVLPTNGSGSYEALGTTHPLAAGDVLVLNPALRGLVQPTHRSTLTFQAFSLKLEHLSPLFTGQEICLLQGIVDTFKGAKSYPASGAVAQHCHRLLKEIPLGFDLEYRSCLLRIAATILAAEFAQAQPESGRANKTELPSLFQRLATDDLVHLSVGELAAKLGCSRRHLNRLFRQRFGMSVAALRMEVRLLRAASLLRAPNAKVINVAEECGFNHLGLFNTCFKRRFHKSPGEWRRVAQESSIPNDKDPNCLLHANGLCSWAATQPTTM